MTNEPIKRTICIPHIPHWRRWLTAIVLISAIGFGVPTYQQYRIIADFRSRGCEFSYCPPAWDLSWIGENKIKEKVSDVLSVIFDWPVVINASRIGVTDEDLPNLVVATHATFVCISGPQITDAGLKHLERMPDLDALSLGGSTQITDAGMSHLIGLGNLRTLQIEGTQVTDAGLVHLAGMTKIEHLFLSGTHITGPGLVHLTGLKRINALGLSIPEFTDAGMPHLSGLTKLRWLNLNETQITNAGLVHLTELTLLETLQLSKTRITDAGLIHLTGLKNLQELYIEDTPVTAAGVATLKAALPHVSIKGP